MMGVKKKTLWRNIQIDKMKQTQFNQIKKKDLDNIETLDFTERIILIDELINTIEDFKRYQLEVEALIIFSTYKDIKIRPALIFERFYKNTGHHQERRIIHKIMRNEASYDGYSYLCNQACNITPSKSTEVDKDVTCKNCLHQMEKKNGI